MPCRSWRYEREDGLAVTNEKLAGYLCIVIDLLGTDLTRFKKGVTSELKAFVKIYTEKGRELFLASYEQCTHDFVLLYKGDETIKPQSYRTLRERCDILTRALCNAMRYVEKEKLLSSCPDALQEWWRLHKEDDRQHQAKD